MSSTLTIPSEGCHLCSSSNNTAAASRPPVSAWDTQLPALIIFFLPEQDFDLRQSVSWQCTSEGTGDVTVPTPRPEFRMNLIFYSSLSTVAAKRSKEQLGGKHLTYLGIARWL